MTEKPSVVFFDSVRLASGEDQLVDRVQVFGADDPFHTKLGQ
jgi:hypothetical protein